MMRTRTVCPFCGVGCGIYLLTQNGRAAGIEGDKECKANDGALCIKGLKAHEFIHNKDRLKSPKIGGKTASWGRAYEYISYKIRDIIRDHGPDSIAFFASGKCTNEENYLLQKLARLLGTNNIDMCARLCHAPSVVSLDESFGSGVMTNSLEDIGKADCFLIVGANPAEQHPVIFQKMLKAKKGGAKLIVIDPRKTETTKRADIHLQITPGTDILLLNAILNHLIENGLTDRQFIETRTKNFQLVKETVSKYALGAISKIIKVPEEDIAKAAEEYAKAERGSIIFGVGITQHITGVETALTLANLAMATGNIGKEGTGVNPLRGQNNVQGACDMGTLPDLFPGYKQVNKENALNLAALWRCERIPSESGLSALEIIDNIPEKIKGMFILGENPAISHPNLTHFEGAMKKLDLLVVSDIFPTETTKLAHVVLPACTWAEKGGTFTNTERRVQKIGEAVKPAGDSKPDWRIISELADKLYLGEHFKYDSPEEIFNEMKKTAPQYSFITYGTLENQGINWPCREGHAEGTKILYEKEFKTDDGLGLFHAAEYSPPAESTTEEYPYVLITGRAYPHFHSRSMTGRMPTLRKIAKNQKAYVEMAPSDAKAMDIKENGLVEVKSRRGGVRVRARISTSLQAGVAFMPFHFQETNRLTNEKYDPMVKIPELKYSVVQIRKAEA